MIQGADEKPATKITVGPDDWPWWPQVVPEPSAADIQDRIDQGFMLCGDPKQVAEQTAASG